MAQLAEQTTLYWLQQGGCGGDTLSFLNLEGPDLTELFADLGITVLWHPSLSELSPTERVAMEDRLVAGEAPLDILVVEGSVVQGPDGTGMFDVYRDQPKRDFAAALARQARYVIAIGTCSAYGGFGVDDAMESTGLQFQQEQAGGLLGAEYRSAAGLPVINLAGCPCHPEVVSGTLSALVLGTPLALDEYQRPVEWYGTMVHQGCTRNEYHEYRVEDEEFGQRGCLFFHKGCHGPLVGGPCNKLLWNRRSSKTRAGVPCFGCTSPGFPQDYPFFRTRNIEGVPVELPNGMNRAHYMAYKTMAAAAAPLRLTRRETKV